jgi:hypothetical protein
MRLRKTAALDSPISAAAAAEAFAGLELTRVAAGEDIYGSARRTPPRTEGKMGRIIRDETALL